jgi:uracil-DNA glycosylase
VLKDFGFDGMSPGWQRFVSAERAKPYFSELLSFLDGEILAGKSVLPGPHQVLRALSDVDICNVRVVILGQDPYHGEDQAIGRSFAVNPGGKMPPSLRNILKELANDVGVTGPVDSSLSGWSEQGVLLLNTVLTVELGKPMSHREQGWETFTAHAISYINEMCSHVVYILWGSAAAAHRAQIDESRNFVLTSVHPSPLSAHRGFFGSRPFSKANEYLRKFNLPAIDWSRPGVDSGAAVAGGALASRRSAAGAERLFPDQSV